MLLMPFNCTLSEMFLLKMVTFYSMHILPLLFKIMRKTTSLLRGKINMYNSSSHNSPKLKAIKMSFKSEWQIASWLFGTLTSLVRSPAGQLAKEHVDFLSLWLAWLTACMIRQHNTHVLKFQDNFGLCLSKTRWSFLHFYFKMARNLFLWKTSWENMGKKIKHCL